MSRGGAAREKETQNLKQAPDSAVSTEPDAGLEPTVILGPKTKSVT